ncbi:GtrA family protein [Longispora sp. NPDC051575]|uniref:GtrA family protein n=1 Tax=Longispora sp. NPDC051575 TaxID=3154943 RepID=UPI003427F54A
MRPILKLVPERWHGLAREVAKFGVVGVINTIVSFGVANLLLHTVFQHGEVKAATAGSLIATVFAYLMNRFWTYRHRPSGSLRREYALFFFFNAVGMGITALVTWITKYPLGLDGVAAFNAAQVVGLVLSTMFRFWAYRTFVFRQAPVVPEPELASR